MPLARMIDLALLRADASEKDIRKLCAEALRFGCKTVCVHPCWVGLCAKILRGSPVGVCAVIGFPLGATTTASKVCEIREALSLGADECDAVVNIGKIKSGDDTFVRCELRALRGAAGHRILKIILETSLLKRNEIVRAAMMAKNTGADFVKTSTGFGLRGALVSDVALIRKTVGTDMGIKASGGIRTREDVLRMICAGATRIGTSSGRRILKNRI